MNETEQYFELLRFCLNEEAPVPECIKDIQWHDLLQFATKQTIVGIYVPIVLMKDKRRSVESFRGNKPCDEEVMEWVFEDYRLRKLSTNMFERTQKASEWFLEQGFRNCILKGQGNALMYPDPMLRAAGDIAVMEKAKYITADHVKRAKKRSEPVEEQIKQRYGSYQKGMTHDISDAQKQKSEYYLQNEHIDDSMYQ